MRLKEIKAAVLKKGWAGRTLSRQATAERLCPLITAHMALNHSYNSAASHHQSPEVRSGIARLQRTARTDVGKLMEVVFSCGAVPPNGTDMEPERFLLPDEGMLKSLQDRERAFQASLRAEQALNHQIRTEAVISHLLTSSSDRLDHLRSSIREEASTR